MVSRIFKGMQVMNMDHDRDRLAINAAKLYYRSEYSQQRIAEELGISRPSVSRLLQYAKDQAMQA